MLPDKITLIAMAHDLIMAFILILLFTAATVIATKRSR